MRWFLVIAVLSGSTSQLAGQAPPAVTMGSRVRVFSVGFADASVPFVEGTIERMSGDTLVLRPRSGGASRVIPAASEAELYVYNGRRSMIGRGAVIGGTIGLVTGGLLGAARDRSCAGNGPSTCGENRSASSLTAALVLGACGAAAGLVIGTFTSHDIWTRSAMVSRRLSFSVGEQGTGLILSIAF